MKQRWAPRVDPGIVDVGVRVTVLTAVSFAALGLVFEGIAPTPLRRVLFLVVSALALVTVLPWTARRARRWLLERMERPWVLYGWATIDVALVTAGLALTAEPAVAYFYLLPVVFFAAMLRGMAQGWLLAAVFLGHVTLVAGRWVETSTGSFLIWTAVTVASAWLSQYLSRELHRRLQAMQEAERLADERARLINHLAEDVRRLFSLDAHEVRSEVVASAERIGAFYVDLYVKDGHAADIRRTGAGEISPAWSDALAAVVERCFRTSRTEVSPRASAEGQPFTLIATPLQIETGPATVLAGLFDHEVSREGVEVFELLAARGSVAIANAERYGDQSRVADELVRLYEIRTELVSTASRELRTPITVVTAALELIQMHGARMDVSRVSDIAKRARGHADALVEFLERLRSISEDAELNVRSNSIRLRHELIASVDRLNQRLLRPRASWAVDGYPTVPGNPSRFRGALDGLFAEFARTAPEGWVSVRAGTGGDVARVELEFAGERQMTLHGSSAAKALEDVTALVGGSFASEEGPGWFRVLLHLPCVHPDHGSRGDEFVVLPELAASEQSGDSSSEA